MKRRERRAAAKKASSESGGARSVAAFCEAGLNHLQADRLLDAQVCCEQALAIDPGCARALHLMGRLSLQAGQLDHAVEWLSRAIAQAPKAESLSSLGAALQRLGRLDDAVKVFDKAVQLEPDDSELWCQLGIGLAEAARPADALLCFQHTIALNPDHDAAAFRAGHLLQELGRFDEALVYLDRSAKLQPNHAPTFAARGLVRAQLKRYEQAIEDYERAIRLDPKIADVYSNLGNAFRALGHLEIALSWYDLSLAIEPTIANATNRAIALTELGRFDEAMLAYRYAMSIGPNHVALVWNFSLFQLWLGDFEAGWLGREMRWKVPGSTASYPKLATPMWNGADAIADKTIVVCQDEALGDTIQFARYVPMLAARGARVILVVDEPLCPLLSGLSGVSHCLPKTQGMVVPPFDFHIAMGSLPLAFGTRLDNIPTGIYLPPPDPHCVQAWEDRLGPRGGLRVGLVWAGNPKHSNDRNRSMPLKLLSRILDVDAAFVSLQKNPRPEDVEILRGRTEIVDHTAGLTDFAQTAALVSCLDLVITVDTSVAHLAGALGRPTWILLPYVADWRWLLGRDDSPWYPTVRLFRQTAERDYRSVVDRVRTELKALRASSGLQEESEAKPINGGLPK